MAISGRPASNQVRAGGPIRPAHITLMLPDLSGIEVIRRIRADSTQAGILAVTAHGDDQTRDLALSAGADSVSTKPFYLNDLLQRAQSRITRDPPVVEYLNTSCWYPGCCVTAPPSRRSVARCWCRTRRRHSSSACRVPRRPGLVDCGARSAHLVRFPRRLGANDSHGSHDHWPLRTASGLSARPGYGSRLHTASGRTATISAPDRPPISLDMFITSAYFGDHLE